MSKAGYKHDFTSLAVTKMFRFLWMYCFRVSVVIVLAGHLERLLVSLFCLIVKYTAET